MFEYFSQLHGTPGRLFRLNYAIDMPYGVLFDIASKVHGGDAIDVSMGYVNVIWQGDANSQALRALRHTTAPTTPLNISGPETVSIRWLAQELGARFGRPPRLTGEEAPTTLLTDTTQALRLFGPPRVSLETMIDWVADWVAKDRPSLNKPTHFEVRDGVFDPQRLDPLAENAISDCVALSSETGWNETHEDWALFLRHGTVFGLLDGRAVASGAILPYPANFAWISMVLVTASHRRKGIGTSVLERCCTEVVARGLLPVLDATPAGELVYRPLGFERMFGISRWQGEGTARSGALSRLRSMTASDLPAVIAVDDKAFGAPRAFLVESLFGRAPQHAFVTNDLTGFVLARPGRIATQIGPVVANDEAAAASLVGAALDSVTGPAFIDLVDRWTAIVNRLRHRGFTVQRPFTQMALNRRDPLGNPENLFAITGPEFG